MYYSLVMAKFDLDHGTSLVRPVWRVKKMPFVEVGEVVGKMISLVLCCSFRAFSLSWLVPIVAEYHV